MMLSEGGQSQKNTYSFIPLNKLQTGKIIYILKSKVVLTFGDCRGTVKKNKVLFHTSVLG